MTNQAPFAAHAIYAVLTDEPFIRASLDSVYPFASAISVITAVDRNWSGERVEPDGTFETVLNYPDPENKLNVYRVWLPDEALARNFAMRAALQPINYPMEPHEVEISVIRKRLEPPDYFWIVDGDEIYDPETVPQIFDWVRARQPSLARVRGVLYFKTWNYQVDVVERFTAFVKPGVWFGSCRSEGATLAQKVLYRVPKIGAKAVDRLWRRVEVPDQAGVYHHGAYVGDRERIVAKMTSHSHRRQNSPTWVEDVWDKWTPDSTDFHPVWPSIFPSAHHVETEDLPRPIREFDWPAGYFGEVSAVGSSPRAGK